MISLGYTPGPAEDPSPDHDLQADVAFGAWLQGLDVVQVLLDLERNFEGEDRLRLRYLRRSFERQQHDPF